MLSIRTAMFYVAAMIIMKSLAGLIALKVQASILAPSSFAVLSQFMTIAGLVTNVSSAMVTSGMTVLLARSASQADRGLLIQTGKTFSLGISCAISMACLTLYWYGAGSISISPLPQYLFLILAISPWVITQSSIAQARLTYSFQLNRFTNVSNVSAIAVAVLIIALTFYFGLIGGAIAVAIGPMLAACIFLLFASNRSLENGLVPAPGDHAKHVAELLRFSTTMLVAICAVPISHILVRESMVATGSAEQAGFWSSAVRLSDVYMQFFGLLLTVYILPKISSDSALNASKRLFTSYMNRLSLIGAIGLGIIFFLREYIVSLALAPEFRPTIELLKIQLPADFFRILLSFFFWFAYGQNLRMLAAAEEVLQACLFYLFFKVVYIGNDARGAVDAHLLASAINAVIIGSCLWVTLSKRREI